MPVLTPTSITEALELLAANPDAQILAGGTDFMVEVNFNHRRPTTVLSLSGIDELRNWRESAGEVFIGSGTTWQTIERGPIGSLIPALAEAARTVGSPQIRAAGTIGGNLGTCSPAGDGLPVLAALEARIHLLAPGGERVVPFADFMVGPKRNSRAADEIISGVSIPIARGYQGFAKVGVRNAMVISICSACLVIHDNTVRVALGSVGPTIIRATAAEQWLDRLQAVPGRAVTPAVAAEFARRVAAEARPIDDHRSTAAYRRHAIEVITRRLLERSTAP